MGKEIKKLSNKDKALDIFKKLVFIFIGNIFSAIAFNVFFSPSKLLSGGVGGISLMVQYLTEIPSGITMFIINLPIFIVGARMVNKDFAIYSFISTLMFSGVLTLTKDFSQYLVVDDILVAAVVGGALNGTGMGIMFRNRSSQGGLDIIAAILKRKYNINISSGLMAINTVIISLSSFLFGIRPAVYTLISMFIAYQIVDKIQVGFNVKKNIMIVSDKDEEVGEAIMKKLGRSVTYIEAVGGYTKESKRMVYCIVVSKEVAKLKEIVDEIDSGAFITISNVVEVEGSTFQKIGI